MTRSSTPKVRGRFRTSTDWSDLSWPASSERQISSFSPPVPSHTRLESKGATMMAAPIVPLTAGFVDSPVGVTFCQVPAAGRALQVPTGGSTTEPSAPPAPPAPPPAPPPFAPEGAPPEQPPSRAPKPRRSDGRECRMIGKVLPPHCKPGQGRGGAFEPPREHG